MQLYLVLHTRHHSLNCTPLFTTFPLKWPRGSQGMRYFPALRMQGWLSFRTYCTYAVTHLAWHQLSFHTWLDVNFTSRGERQAWHELYFVCESFAHFWWQRFRVVCLEIFIPSHFSLSPIWNANFKTYHSHMHYGTEPVTSAITSPLYIYAAFLFYSLLIQELLVISVITYQGSVKHIEQSCSPDLL